MHPNLFGLVLASHRVFVDSADAIDPDLKAVLGSVHKVVINNGGDSTSIIDAITTLGIVFMAVVVPCFFIFGRGRRPRGAEPSAEQGQAATELWDRARRMETRIEYLERVLDSEMPGWRNRS